MSPSEFAARALHSNARYIKSVERIHSFDGELTCISSLKVLIKDFEVKVADQQIHCR